MTRRELVLEEAMEDWLRQHDPDRYPGPGPVTADRNRRVGEKVWIVISMVLMPCTLLVGLFWAGSVFTGGGSPMLLLFFVPLLAFLAYATVGVLVSVRVPLLEKGIDLDEDRIRSMRDGRVLMEVPFDRDTEIEVLFPPGSTGRSVDDVVAYTFRRGHWGGTYVSSDDYPREVIRAIWPNVKAAASKHRVRIGKNMRLLMASEEGEDPERKKSARVWPPELLLHQEQ